MCIRDRSYSCGYFKNPEDTLYQAQVNKVDYILEKLCLKEGMTLLDIGCGWGFLLIEAAKKYRIRGTGITLSKEQYQEFQRRIEEENLQDVYKRQPLCFGYMVAARVTIKGPVRWPV